MLLYLTSNSHPELSFAVTQCARFVHSPTVNHGIALKKIGRYLLANRKTDSLSSQRKIFVWNYLLTPISLALWNHEDTDDPVCVRSRMGYMITLGGAPILWGSKLQTETALSTMMADSMRELIPGSNGCLQGPSRRTGSLETN